MAHPTASGSVDLLLVGRRLPDNENLGIGYLLAAARRAGLRAEMLTLNGWEGLASTALRIVAADPPLLGLALPDGSSAVLPLSLGQLVRDAGYRGHITAGGPFATLARNWLLERHPFLDSVVRYAGEAPLVALAEALSLGRPLSEVVGLTTRQGGEPCDGLPAPVLDSAQTELVPVRGELPQLLGHAMAQMTATRGCPGRCAYCGPASLQEGELNEGRAAGFSSLQLRTAGVGSVRRRPLEALCDEVAYLWHEREVRYVYFVDEHLLPRRRDDALVWIGGLRAGLERRGVGRLGFGCMLRGDLLSEPVIEAFADAGLVRCFLGVELASAADLARFERGGRIDRALASMRALDRRGVAVSCNLMLVHPDATVASIGDGIALARSFDAVSFEAAQMHVYHGTLLHQRMEAEGRLLGNPLQYAYTFTDPAVERFADLLNRLRLEAFGDYSLTCKVHDAAIALRLGERLFPDASTGDLQVALTELSRASNRLRTDACEEALELAVEGFDDERAGRFVARATRAAQPLARDVDRLSGHLLARFERPPARFTPLRAAAVPLVSVCLAGAMACHPAGPDATESPVHVPPVSTSTVASARPSAEPGGGAVPSASTAPPPRACSGARADEVSSPGGAEDDRARLRQALESCQGAGYSGDSVRVEIGPGGKVQSVDSEPPGRLAPALRSCIVRVVQGLRFPCLAGTTQRPWPKQMVIME